MVASLRVVCVLFVVFFAARVRAQSEDWHFEADASRHARVDDRGGLGEGYSFSIEYDETDGNSEDFCPHCRLSIMVSDPGLDITELERLGAAREAIDSAGELLSTLQSLAAADAGTLASTLSPDVSGDDLAALVAEIVRIQGEIREIVMGLERFATLQASSFDWSGASLDTLVQALSLQMDTAFHGDFSDLNDPRIHNSGVAVYDLPALIAGLAASGIPPAGTAAIESALSSVPGLSGSCEMSGDDGDVLSPASFHGYHTDVTVRQRTYAVNGHSAYLVVYTVVNETTRVLPLVEVSMMADFDIPPLSYDSATAFDPASQMVMLYDTIPYTMPEQHYWFGLAPAAITAAPVPGAFSFAAYNLDQNMTLAQLGSSTTQDNRFRFFLFDPALIGDHDTAVGKSEKQGAVSMILDGPLLPGDARSVAFCFAAGEGTSNGAARTELTAVMTGCRALYTALNPSCGDGVTQYPEDCDGGASCNASCQTVACGDGRLDSPEACDDGNTTDGDGCDASCVVERCGNGIVQAGESCDDGNDSSLDACLNDCTTPRCGDGIVRAGVGCTGPDCGCAGYQYCWSGTTTMGRILTSSRFAALAGLPIDFRLGFDVVATDTRALALENGVRLTTGPVHVEMSGAPLAASIAAAIDGDTFVIDLRGTPLAASAALSTTRLEGTFPRSTTIVGFDLSAMLRTAITVSVDRGGTPIFRTLRITSGLGRFSVVPATGTPTDTVSGRTTASVATIPAGSAGELCDDGNASDFDACTNACVPATCGDGILQASEGEQCDEGPSPPAWCTGCLRTGSSCGNGTTEAAFGEECDDSNAADGDGCSAICRTERCGDGVVLGIEGCDDGNDTDGDGCTTTCLIESCGDGVVQPREACDEGPSNADTAACLTTCLVAACGDGLVHAGVEGCDDGNDVIGDGCNATCEVERCGDGAPGPDEECDDGNAEERDGCSPTCLREICGDGLPGPMEQCDDGNVVDGDGCDKDCLLENLTACGDGRVQIGEQCDDGGMSAGDGCSAFCQLEDPAACGNGTLDPGETCDDGNDVGGDGCSTRCTDETCGDGIQATGEQCDDGNDTNGDGCSSTCVLEPTMCGNGIQELGEQCDGGADCDATCQLTAPAPLGMTCGDGDQDAGEQCDDGGRRDGDGCDETCQLEGTTCGNARLERGETCDDGGTEVGDGCDAECLLEGDVTPPAPAGCSCRVGTRASAWWLVACGLALALVLRRRRA